MKKTVLMLAAAGLMLATPSCKKGENDPAISFLSRKARISNSWVVTSIMSTTTTTDGDGDSWSTDQDFDGTTMMVESSSTSGGTTVSNTMTYTYSDYSITIEKDGTYEMSLAYTYEEEDDWSWPGYTTTETHNVTSTTTGTWSFVGKTKDEYKKKERVLFNELTYDYEDKVDWVTTEDASGNEVDDGTNSNSTSETYSHGESIMTFAIDKLKNKEMTWIREYDGSDSDTNSSGSTSTTTTQTTTGSGTWELEEK